MSRRRKFIQTPNAPEGPPRFDYETFDPERADRETLLRVVAQVHGDLDKIRQENAILFYEPVPDAVAFHQAREKNILISGGNASSKTEALLAEIVMYATGMCPYSLRDKLDFKTKFRGPVNCRIVVQSFTTTLQSLILRKLQFFHWFGIDKPGGKRGHWGWIPRQCLPGYEWEKAWSEKYRTLTVLCRNPDDYDEILGESQIQFMAHNQDVQDHASGEFHIVGHDECPSLGIWRENEARTFRVGGRNIIAMTWPEDPTFPVDWIMDELYEPGIPGPTKSPEVRYFEFQTQRNQFADQEQTAEKAKIWDADTVAVRLYGRPRRLRNLVHHLFTDRPTLWCMRCHDNAKMVDAERCACGSDDIVEYTHVQRFDLPSSWPVVLALDPHPRKPHVLGWYGIDPADDVWMVAEHRIDGGPLQVREECDRLEHEFGLFVARRIIDPNMARSPASATRRHYSWQDEFDAVGLRFDLADDDMIGQQRVNEYLRVDDRTRRPRLIFHPRCEFAIGQMKRFMWSDWKVNSDRDQKQEVKEKHDDHPALLRYLLNLPPRFRMLKAGPRVIQTRRRAVGGTAWRG